MKRINLGLLFLVVFMAGCMAMMAVQPLIVPPVRANTNPAKWEYLCVQLSPAWKDSAMAKFNEMGSQGWKLSTTYRNSNIVSHCFERQLP